MGHFCTRANTPASANVVAQLEPTTPNLHIPLPGYTLDIDLIRIRDAFYKVDALAVSLEDNNNQAADTAQAAHAVAAEAKREAEKATGKAVDAMTEALSKATADDLAAHDATKDAHGATPEAEPGRIALRDEYSRIKVGGPASAQDAANKEYVDATQAVATQIVLGDVDALRLVLAASGKLLAYLTATSGSWVAPDDNGDGSDYDIGWKLVAPGGGGGYADALVNSARAGGGGQGERIIGRTKVTPGTAYPFVNGAKGTGSSNNSTIGGKGGTSSFAGQTAEGGYGGISYGASNTSTMCSGGGQNSVNVANNIIRIRGADGDFPGYAYDVSGVASQLVNYSAGRGGGEQGGAARHHGVITNYTPGPGCGGGGGCFTPGTPGGAGYLLIWRA